MISSGDIIVLSWTPNTLKNENHFSFSDFESRAAFLDLGEILEVNGINIGLDL